MNSNPTTTNKSCQNTSNKRPILIWMSIIIQKRIWKECCFAISTGKRAPPPVYEPQQTTTKCLRNCNYIVKFDEHHQRISYMFVVYTAKVKTTFYATSITAWKSSHTHIMINSRQLDKNDILNKLVVKRCFAFAYVVCNFACDNYLRKVRCKTENSFAILFFFSGSVYSLSTSTTSVNIV